MTTIKLKDLYLKAADYLDEHGHIKGVYGGRVDMTDGCPACLYGAMGSVAGLDFKNIEIIETAAIAKPLVDVLGDKLSKEWLLCKTSCLQAWNDDDDTSKDDVTAVLRKAAASVPDDVVLALLVED